MLLCAALVRPASSDGVSPEVLAQLEQCMRVPQIVAKKQIYNCVLPILYACTERSPTIHCFYNTGYGAHQAYRKVVEEEYGSGDDYTAFEQRMQDALGDNCAHAIEREGGKDDFGVRNIVMAECAFQSRLLIIELHEPVRNLTLE